MTPGANFATGTASVVDTGGKFAADVNLKVSWKEKIYLYVYSTTQRSPNKIIKTFLMEDVSICHRVNDTGWCTLSCEYPQEFSKKFETPLMGLGAWGNLIHEKT
jgi:hypothetical protein